MDEVKREVKVAYYSCDREVETLYYETASEAIEAYLDECIKIPETVTLYSWARLTVDPEWLSQAIMNDTLERLDEEYNNYEGAYPSEPTEAQKTAALLFARTLLLDYRVGNCEIVTEEAVNAQAWIEANRPGWIP